MTLSCESIAPEAEEVLERAAPEALSLGLDYVGTEAVLLAMIRVGTPELADTLRRVGSSFTQLEAAIRQSTVGCSFPPPVEPLAFASRATRAVEYAGQCARTFRHSQISNQDLLVGLLIESEGLAHSLLADIGVDIPTVLADEVSSPGARRQVESRGLDLSVPVGCTSESSKTRGSTPPSHRAAPTDSATHADPRAWLGAEL